MTRVLPEWQPSCHRPEYGKLSGEGRKEQIVSGDISLAFNCTLHILGLTNDLSISPSELASRNGTLLHRTHVRGRWFLFFRRSKSNPMTSSGGYRKNGEALAGSGYARARPGRGFPTHPPSSSFFNTNASTPLE